MAVYVFSKWRPPPSWIYFRCRFFSYSRFWIMALYVPAKFDKSTSLCGWVIKVCPKIQNGGCPPSWGIRPGPQYVYGPISRKRLKIESRLQWNAYRKCYMGHQMVTWPMTSRDPKRSRSWPRYIWSQISRNHMEIGTWFQWSTNRKPYMGNGIVTWSMTSRDLERSRSWPQYV